jgi:endonuclease/exonuclease/phosphatase family metal-dependent hydrolase
MSNPVLGTVRSTIAAIAVGGLVFSGPAASAHPAPERSSPGPAERGSVVRIGTFNINAGLPVDQWRQAVQAFIPRVDIAGLQEAAGKDKAAALKSMPGINSYVSQRFLQEPIFWNPDAFGLIRGRSPKIADGRMVEDRNGGGLVHQDSTLATVVRLRSKVSGETISVVNVHLIQGAVNAGKPLPGVPRRVGMYADQVRHLGKVVRAEKRWAGGPVWVVGDFNVNYGRDKAVHKKRFAYSTMRRRDLVASWEARKGELQPGHGSGARSGAYLDVIWSTRRARSVDVLREDPFRVSDHFPVVSTYAAP